MHYEELAPPPELAGQVVCLWTLSGATRRETFDLILPDGRPELVIHRGDPFRRRLSSGHIRRQPRRLLVGQMTSAVAIAPGRRVDTVGVRFAPAGLAPLCPFPQSRIANRLVRVEILHAPLLEAPTRAALAAPTSADAVIALRRGLLEAYRGVPPVDPRVVQAITRITDPGRAASLTAVARACGLSPRTLERHVLDVVGIGPKRLARLARFRRAVAALEASPGRAGASVALDHGYYDQAHFITEFREFAGDAPRRFVDRRLAALTRFFVDRHPAA